MTTSTRRDLIADGIARVDRNDVSGACRVCLRLARGVKDLMSAAIFLREVSPTRQLFMDSFFPLAHTLNEEARKYLFDKSFETWVLQRDLNNGKGTPEEKSVFFKSIGELETDLEQFRQQVAKDFVVPPGMHPTDTAMFEDRSREARAVLHPHIQKLTSIIERTKARCYNYLLHIEVIEDAQESQSVAFDGIVVDILGYFKNADPGVYEKIISIGTLAVKKDGESRSLLLTGIRRAYKSTVDHFYPPTAGMTQCTDGVERDLGPERYINRAKEFVRTKGKGETHSAILTAHVEHMDRLASKINELASKGVHAEVDQREALQCLISFYGFVQSLITLKLHV